MYIVGAGGFGREIFSALSGVLGYGDFFSVAGFIDDDANALDGYEGYPQIVGSLKDFVPRADDVFFVAIGNVAVRKNQLVCSGVSSAVSVDSGSFFASALT